MLRQVLVGYLKSAEDRKLQWHYFGKEMPILKEKYPIYISCNIIVVEGGYFNPL